MKAKSNDAWTFKGTPPCDGREWKSIVDVAAKMGIKRQSVYEHARRWGWTLYRQNHNRTWILKSDVDSYLEFINTRKRAYKRRDPEHWKPEIGIIEDEELLKRVFWTAQQAALYMGVSVNTIYLWVKKGKIPVFFCHTTGRSRRKWFSPSSLRHLKEDEQYLKGKATWEKARDTMRAGVVARQVYKLRYKPQYYRKQFPGWITTREAADRLDIGIRTVLDLQRKGRILGRQMIKGRLEDTRGWMQKELCYNHSWFFHEQDIEDYRNSEDYQTRRQRGLNAALLGAKKIRPPR